MLGSGQETRQDPGGGRENYLKQAGQVKSQQPSGTGTTQCQILWDW